MPDQQSPYKLPWEVPNEGSEPAKPNIAQQPIEGSPPQDSSKGANQPEVPEPSNKPRTNHTVLSLLALGGIIAVPIFWVIGTFFSLFLGYFLSHTLEAQVYYGLLNSLLPFVIMMIFFISFSPLFLYKCFLNRKLFKIYAAVGILIIVIPVVMFFINMADYNRPPSKIARPEKFLISNDSFYIYDQGKIWSHSVMEEVKTISKPPLIWEFNFETGELKDRLRLEDEKSKRIESSLVSPKKNYPENSNCFAESVLIEKSNKKVETYKIYEKNNEILLYPKKGVASSMIDGSRVGGYTKIIKLSDKPLGLFKFKNDVYVITSNTSKHQRELIKIDTSTKEKITLTTMDVHGYFSCRLENQILQVSSSTTFVGYYNLNEENYMFNVELNTNYSNSFYDIGNDILAYDKGGLKVISKKDNKIIKDYDGDFFSKRFDYNENYVIFYQYKKYNDNTVYLLNKDNLRLLKFTGT
jgi:hypothetical protein